MLIQFYKYLMLARQIAFFLFINTTSGGNLGKQYLTLQAESITFRFRNLVHVYFFDLIKSEQTKRGVELVKKFQKQYDIRVIICGGDGTVLWIIDQLIKGQVNLQLVTFGIIPIGTGNDFSQTLGWGTQPQDFSQKKLSNIKSKIKIWLKAKIQKYDIWDFDLELYEDGQFRKIKNKQEVVLPEKIMSRSFCNYFGIGIDARIGYSFEKRRTKSRLLNLLCYGCIGCFKWFKSINHIHDIIQNMEQQSNRQELIKNEEQLQSNQFSFKKDLIFHTNKQSYGIDNHLKRNFKAILCLNSKTFMGGVRDIWQTSKVSLENHDKQFYPQSFSDGKIQFVNFQSEIELGLQRILSGRGSKLAQGSGPFYINFRKTEQNNGTFLQLDGEFFKMTNPKVLKIERTKKIIGSQIKVMVNPN